MINLFERLSAWGWLTAAAVSLTVACPGHAIIISGGGGSAPLNNTAPLDDPGFDRVGSFETAGGNGSGVYLGDGWVLSANHVNARDIFTLNGNTYQRINGTSVRLDNPTGQGLTTKSDLVLARYEFVSGSAPTPQGMLTINTSTPAAGTPGVLIGTGQTQTSQTASTYYADTTTDPQSWTWDTAWFSDSDRSYDGFINTGARDKRWGETDVTAININGDVQFSQFLDFSSNSLDADQIGFVTLFEDELNSAMGAPADSGAGYFIKVNGEWVLAGLAHALFGFNNQPANTALPGNATFVSDLSVYADQINAIIPEPATALLLAAGVPLIGRRRRR